MVQGERGCWAESKGIRGGGFPVQREEKKRGKVGGEFKYPLRGGPGASAKIFKFLTGK